MVKYEERHKEICAIGCSFEDDQIFKDFLDEIEKLKGNEKNYYSLFRLKMEKIVKYKQGVQENPVNSAEGISTTTLIPKGHIKITYNPEFDKEKELIIYKIRKIEIYENATLKKWHVEDIQLKIKLHTIERLLRIGMSLLARPQTKKQPPNHRALKSDLMVGRLIHFGGALFLLACRTYSASCCSCRLFFTVGFWQRFLWGIFPCYRGFCFIGCFGLKVQSSRQFIIKTFRL